MEKTIKKISFNEGVALTLAVLALIGAVLLPSPAGKIIIGILFSSGATFSLSQTKRRPNLFICATLGLFLIGVVTVALVQQ